MRLEREGGTEHAESLGTVRSLELHVQATGRP